jgi:hypothetical protein
MKLNSGVCYRNRDLVLSMVGKDNSLSEIARTVGTNKRHVRTFLKREGVSGHFPTTRPGERNPKWRCGRVIDEDGYVLIYNPDHPHVRKHVPYVLEHRLVMEKVVGRLLNPKEVVHHKDGNKLNNSPQNLQLFGSNGKHLECELKGKCPKWTEIGLIRMREAVSRSADRRRKSTPALRQGPSAF